MDLKKIKSLIDLLAVSPLVELELIEGDDKVRLIKRSRREAGSVSGAAHRAGAATELTRDAAHQAGAATGPARDTEHGSRPRGAQAAVRALDQPQSTSAGGQPAAPCVARAPMYGIVHLQPSPDDPAFVQAGDAVKAGQVLCTIEAMKVFHAIESEYDGRVAEVLATSGDEVEAGQPLFRIER